MLSIVIPSYNEQDNLSALFQRLDAVVKQTRDVEIIVVDNGSTDNSPKVLMHELDKRDRSIFKTVRVEKNIGYGYGILSGLRSASGQTLAVTHADRQTDPMDVLKAFDIYIESNDTSVMVKGARKNRKITEAVFSYGMGLVASLVLKSRLTEVNAQPKLFNREFFEAIEKDAPHDFSLDLYLMYHAKKTGRILEFPVFFAKRVAGEAKGGSGSSWKVRIKLMKRIFKYIFELSNKLNHKK